MADRFLLLGATGLVGGEVLRLLRRQGASVTGASRRQTGQGWVRFDLCEPATFAPALANVTHVLLVSRPGDEQAHEHAAPLVAAMVAAGVQRVVVLSALHADRRPDFSIRKVERLVEDAGLAWTHVRPNFFAQMLARPPLATEIATTRTLSLPLGRAEIAYVDARDVAAVCRLALTEPALVGRAIKVSGPQAFHHEAVAALLGRLLDEPVRYVDITEEQARNLLAARGFPAPQIERVLGFYALCRQGLCAAPDVEVARLLGRPLGRLEAVLAAHRTAWQAPAGC